jgi:hypothetical protein
MLAPPGNIVAYMALAEALLSEPDAEEVKEVKEVKEAEEKTHLPNTERTVISIR